ncbi:MAG: hypothetical protein WB696_03215 [Chthoniobacterales bacterium]|jgi:hypothetical protein
MPNLNDFLSRIQTDHAFYLEFRRNPEEALEPYELSAEERALVTESREQLWMRVGRSSSCWKIGCNYVLLGSGELEFNAEAALGRPEIQSTIDEIRKASMDSDRLTSVLALMEQIG